MNTTDQTTPADTFEYTTADELARAVVHELQRRADPATRSPSWPGVLAAINTDPRPFARALGMLAVTPRAGRTFH